jgi:hypothetical protein
MLELLKPMPLDNVQANLKVLKLNDYRSVSFFLDHIFRRRSTNNCDQGFSGLNRVLRGSWEKSVKFFGPFIDWKGKPQNISKRPGRPKIIPLAIGLVLETYRNWFYFLDENGDHKLELARLDQWSDRCFQWSHATFGPGLISAVLHCDEQSPHIHLLVEGQYFSAFPKMFFADGLRYPALLESFGKAMAPLGLELPDLDGFFLPVRFGWGKGPKERYYQLVAKSDKKAKDPKWFPVDKNLSCSCHDWLPVGPAESGLKIQTAMANQIDRLIAPMEAMVNQIHSQLYTRKNQRTALRSLESAISGSNQKSNNALWDSYHQSRSLEQRSSESNLVSPKEQETSEPGLTTEPDDKYCGTRSLLDYSNFLTGRQDEYTHSAVRDLWGIFKTQALEKALVEDGKAKTMLSDDIYCPDPLEVFEKQTGVSPSMVESLTVRGQIYRDRCDGLLFPVKEGLFLWDPITGLQGDMGLSSWELGASEAALPVLKKRTKPICLATSHPVLALILKSIFVDARVVAVPNNCSIDLKPIFKGWRVILVDQLGKDQDQRTWGAMGGQLLNLQPRLGLNEFSNFLQAWRQETGEERSQPLYAAPGADQEKENDLTSLQSQVKNWYKVAKLEMRNRVFFKALTGIDLARIDLEELWKILIKNSALEGAHEIQKVKSRHRPAQDELKAAAGQAEPEDFQNESRPDELVIKAQSLFEPVNEDNGSSEDQGTLAEIPNVQPAPQIDWRPDASGQDGENYIELDIEQPWPSPNSRQMAKTKDEPEELEAQEIEELAKLSERLPWWTKVRSLNRPG